MKPILVLITVLFALGLAIPLSAAGQQATQTTEISLTPEQLGGEIAAWKKQLAELVEDLSDPSKIWVRLQGGETVATDDRELVGALREYKIFELIGYAGESRLLGFRDPRLEVKSLFRDEVESFVKETYAELVKQDKAIREIKEQQAERLREIIRTFEKKRADALASRPQQAGTPVFKPEDAAVTDSEINAVKKDLDDTRLLEKWDLRDHGYVLGYLNKVKTPAQLRRVKELIKRFSACYKAWNTKMAEIAAEAKAGNWMPGKRIEEGDKALRDRNDRLRREKASFEEAWQTP